MFCNWKETKESGGMSEKSYTIKILGVHKGKNMEQKNWQNKIPKIQGKLFQWKDRELSLIGEILVIKAEVIAALSQLTATIPPPYGTILTLRKIIFQFIWGGQHEKLKKRNNV